MSENDKILYNNGVYYFREGWRQKIGNITKIYTKGTDYERGFQLGVLLSHEIKSVIKHFFSFIANNNRDDHRFLKCLIRKLFFLAKPIIFLTHQKKIQRLTGKYPEWIIKEIEGMASGAGINSFWLKFINFIHDEESETADAKSCCSFAFMGKDGNLYHGKNLDWVPIIDHVDLFCFQQREDENGDWFGIIGPPGYLNAYEFGMNSHGISIGLTGRFYRGKRASKRILTNIVELNALRYGNNLKSIQKIYDTKTGFNRSDGLLISSFRDTDFQLFEVTPIGAAVTSSTAGILFTTNTYIHPIFHKYNRQWGNIYNNEFCDPRYKRLRELLSQKPDTLEDAFRILADDVQPGFEHKSFLGQATINRFITNVSAVMVQGKNPGIWIAKAHTYAAYHEYSFFDFSNLPQVNTATRIKPAHQIVKSNTLKNFKDFIYTRESRYYVSMKTIIRNGKQLLQKEPTNPIFILFLAQNYLKNGEIAQAVTLLEKHPIQWIADYWYSLGQCRKHLEQYEKAKECFSKAMTLPSVDGFEEMVRALSLVQLLKINEKLNLNEEALLLKSKWREQQTKFSTPNIGMPDYPNINNIIEQIEQLIV